MPAMVRRVNLPGKFHNHGTDLLLSTILLWIIVFRVGGEMPAAAGAGALTPQAYLPLVRMPESCPKQSSNQYQAGIAFQYDLDDPVRPAELHADKNIALRGATQNFSPGLRYDLVDYGSNTDVQPPQLATLFKPARVAPFSDLFQVYNWIWAPSPATGVRGSPISFPPVTAVLLEVNPGDILYVPSSGFDIGAGKEVIVLYADEDTVALRYTREDSSGSPGYTLHLDGFCTDPNLLKLYQSLDDPGGPRYVYVAPGNRPYSYDLPVLAAGEAFGTILEGRVLVAISDTGAFQDPRSCHDWWQIRPGYGTDCSR